MKSAAKYASSSTKSILTWNSKKKGNPQNVR